MTDKQINAAIATDVLGWHYVASDKRTGWYDGNHSLVSELAYWNPLHNADDFQRAEAALPEDRREAYSTLLAHAMISQLPMNPTHHLWKARQLPLRTCCEALLEAVK